MAPTMGLGSTQPCPRAASFRANCMWFLSASLIFAFMGIILLGIFRISADSPGLGHVFLGPVWPWQSCFFYPGRQL